MATGKPSISDIRGLDVRAIATAVANIRQRIEGVEASLGVTASIAQTTANAGGLQAASILAQITALSNRVLALENATQVDIGNYVAGETISPGEGVIPLSSSTIGGADPSDPTRMFGLIGVAVTGGNAGATIQVQRRGVYTVQSSPGFVAGRAVYVTAGGLTQTPEYNATALPIGVAVSASLMFVAPDWPALLYETFSSGFADEYQRYLPATFQLVQRLADLAMQIAGLPFSSGVDADALVPVGIGSDAVTVYAGDIARLIFAAPFSSGVDVGALVPVLMNGTIVLVSAGDIAAL